MKTNFMFFALATALLVTACASTEQKPKSEVIQQTMNDLTYEVPVPKKLKDVATFKIPVVHMRIENNVTEIKYDLPLELTGVRNEVVLQSVSEGKFAGANAEATCEGKVCRIKYKNLTVDQKAVAALFKERGAKPKQIKRHVAVAAHFGNDPAGIVYLP